MTERQKKFIEEYLIDLNASQAAIRAGYSPKSAAAEGSRLLINVKVATEIDKKKAARARLAGYNQERVLLDLGAIASDAGQKTTDQLKALELIGKHLGMFKDSVGLTLEAPRIIDDWAEREQDDR